MEKSAMAASVSFICRLLYDISGLDSAINSILKMPKHFFEGPKISFILSAINVLDENSRLNQIVSISRRFLTSHTQRAEMHFLIALSKLVSFLFGYMNFVSMPGFVCCQEIICSLWSWENFFCRQYIVALMRFSIHNLCCILLHRLLLLIFLFHLKTEKQRGALFLREKLLA